MERVTNPAATSTTATSNTTSTINHRSSRTNSISGSTDNGSGGGGSNIANVEIKTEKNDDDLVSKINLKKISNKINQSTNKFKHKSNY